VSVALLKQFKSAMKYQVDFVYDFLVVSQHERIGVVLGGDDASILDDSFVVKG